MCIFCFFGIGSMMDVGRTVAGYWPCCFIPTRFFFFFFLTGADLGITSPAAALALVVPPFVFQFVQKPLLVQF